MKEVNEEMREVTDTAGFEPAPRKMKILLANAMCP